MGRIKSMLIKRTARSMIKEGSSFSGDFERNKKILDNFMPSKSLRNRIAGYITRIKRNEEKKRVMLNSEQMQ